MARLGGAGKGLGHGQQDVVPDDAERGSVLLGPQGFAPAVQLPQRRELSRRQRLRSFHAQKCIRSAAVGRPCPAQLFEVRELLLRPRQSTERREPGAQLLAQRRQVRRIRRRIGEHGRRERATRPVRLLVLLCELHAGILFQQCREADRRLAGQLGGDARVEQPPRSESVVTIENPQVVIRVVEDLLDLRVGQQPAHGREVRHRQGVDDLGP